MFYIVTSADPSSGVTLNNYDAMAVYAGGVATDTTVDGFAYLAVSSGGLSLDTTLIAGVEYVNPSGMARHTTISGGAAMYVESGGKAVKTEIEAQGFLDMNAGGLLGRGTKFDPAAPGGTLVLEGTDLTKQTIHGFAAGDVIALKDIDYTAGDTATVTKNGIVTISAGGETYKLHIGDAVKGETNFGFAAIPFTSGGSELFKIGAIGMPFIAPKAAGVSHAALAGPAGWTTHAATTAAPRPAAIQHGGIAHDVSNHGYRYQVPVMSHGF